MNLRRHHAGVWKFHVDGRNEAIASPAESFNVNRLKRVVAQSQPDLVDAFVKAMIEINMRSIGPENLGEFFPA